MISGIILLDKKKGISSNFALQKVKRILKKKYEIKKIGHSGSLDPLATGMLPIFINEATKFCNFLLDADKIYETKIKLGVTTDSLDSDGNILEQKPVPEITKEYLENVLSFFRGKIIQIPPMHSALKHNGQPLYKLARKGIEIERKKREVEIFELSLIDFNDDSITLRVHCSKGTYIRTLAADIGEKIGCGAHVTELRRTQAGPYKKEGMISIESLESVVENESELFNLLYPIESAAHKYPVLELSDEMAFYIKKGQAVFVPKVAFSGIVVLKEKNGKLIGVGSVLDDGKVAPKRLLSNNG